MTVPVAARDIGLRAILESLKTETFEELTAVIGLEMNILV